MGTSSSKQTLLSSGQVVYTQQSLSSGSGTFTASVGSLNEATTYYYVAFMEVLVGGSYQTITGNVRSFTTASTSTANTANGDWLELPASPASLGSMYLVTPRATYNGQNVRNYTILYDPSRYASLWVAYTLYSGVYGGGGSSSWTNNPLIPASKQTSVKKSYGEVNGVTYDRGHQIANADRSETSMNEQTFYWTNSTPQLSEFNAGIWANLEAQARTQASYTDTLYVTTGPVYKTVGGNESVFTFANTANDSKIVPVPNYYYKVLLKVRRSSGVVTAASAIGFWFTHEAHTGENWQNFAVSVDEIEQKTGFDFFANLPDGVEASAEANANWNTFKNF